MLEPSLVLTGATREKFDDPVFTLGGHSQYPSNHRSVGIKPFTSDKEMFDPR